MRCAAANDFEQVQGDVLYVIWWANHNHRYMWSTDL